MSVIWRNTFDGVPGTVVSNDLGGPGTSGQWGDPIVNLRNTADVNRVRYGDRAFHGRSSLMLGDDAAVSGNHGDVQLTSPVTSWSVSFYMYRTGDGWVRFLQDGRVNTSDLYLDYGSGAHFVGWTEVPASVADEMRDRWVRVEAVQGAENVTWRFWWSDPESEGVADAEVSAPSTPTTGYLFVQGGGSSAEHPPAYLDSIRVGDGEWLGPWREHTSTTASGRLTLSGSAEASSEEAGGVTARGTFTLSGSASASSVENELIPASGRFSLSGSAGASRAGVAGASGSAEISAGTEVRRTGSTAASGSAEISAGTEVRRDAGTAASGRFSLSGSAEATRHADASASGRVVLRSRAVPSSDASLSLDYAAGHIAPPFEPVDDDTDVVNRVQASRRDGGEATYSLDEGPLGTADPPEGIGVYDSSVTLDVQRDEDLGSQASWRVHLGTTEGYRYPSATVDLVGRPQLLETVADRDTGSALQVINPPPWLPPENIELMVEGYTETINAYTWTIEFNSSQGNAWTVAAVLGEDEEGPLPPGESQANRADTAGAELFRDIDEWATSFNVVTREGPRWITSGEDADEFPFDVQCGGEVMRVQSIAGLGVTQTFEVIRAVNTVRLAHPSGESVSLAQPAVIAL